MTPVRISLRKNSAMNHKNHETRSQSFTSSCARITFAFVRSMPEFCLQCAGVLFAACNSFACSVNVYFHSFFLVCSMQEMMFKSMNGLAPEYRQSLFSQRRLVYNLRDSEGKLTLPKPSTNYLKRSFSYSGLCYGITCPKA